jgi:Glycosyl transferase family 2
MKAPRAVALLATYNEDRFVEACLDHLIGQGLSVHLCDDGSTDGTVARAERFLGRGLIGIETGPRRGLGAGYRRKEQLATELDFDWFLHVDADEFHVSPQRGETLLEAIARAEREGHNAVNFLEFAFTPVRESPDHDHPQFRETMHWYHPLMRKFPHRLNAWKRQKGPVRLTAGGHRVQFPGLRMSPRSLYMRHYLYLSVPHAIQKYVHQGHTPEDNTGRKVRWRHIVRPEVVELPPASAMRTYTSDDELDPRDPRRTYWLEDLVLARTGPTAAERTPAALDFLVMGADRRSVETMLDLLRQHPDHSARGAALPKGMSDEAEEVARRTRDELPSVRLIAVLRDPLERAVAHWRDAVRDGRERRPAAEALDPTGPSEYVAPGEYGRLLAPWRRHFPPEQVLVLLTGELERRPQRAVRIAFSHIGLDAAFVPPGLVARGPRSPAETLDGPTQAALAARYAEDAELLARDWRLTVPWRAGGETPA